MTKTAKRTLRSVIVLLLGLIAFMIFTVKVNAAETTENQSQEKSYIFIGSMEELKESLEIVDSSEGSEGVLMGYDIPMGYSVVGDTEVKNFYAVQLLGTYNGDMFPSNIGKPIYQVNVFSQEVYK